MPDGNAFDTQRKARCVLLLPYANPVENQRLFEFLDEQ